MNRKIVNLANPMKTVIMPSIYCPGCKQLHPFPPDRWSYNGNEESPTFSPSMLINKDYPNRCHSFVTDGKIIFLEDCYHELAGKTVELEDPRLHGFFGSKIGKCPICGFEHDREGRCDYCNHYLEEGMAEEEIADSLRAKLNHLRETGRLDDVNKPLLEILVDDYLYQPMEPVED